MIPFANVLVATDFGPTADAALRCASDLAVAYSAALHVVHVVVRGNNGGGLGARDTPALDDQPAAAADAALQRRLESELAGALRDPVTPAPTVAVLHAASAAAGIIGYARSHAVDVIVLGTHGHSGLEDFFLGSVAQKLVRSAPCPVVTVRACPPDLS